MSINISKGFITKLRGRLNFLVYPELNLTFDDMGEDGITVTATGNSVETYPVGGGQIQQPNIYVPVEIAFSLHKNSNALSRFLARENDLAILYDAVFKADSNMIPDIVFANCAIQKIGPFDWAKTAVVPFVITAARRVNTSTYL